MLGLSALSGIVMLVVLALVFGESMPSASAVKWSAMAGVAGAVGLASLYQGLAVGRVATVAPTAAVLTAALPVVFNALTEGLPRPSQVAGFACAIAGIWMVARGAAGRDRPTSGLKLALLAGTGFGAFLILIAQVETSLVFTPLAIARTVIMAMAGLALLVRRVSLPSLTGNPIALLAGALDAGGNVFFLVARQHTRLDVAAVLSSLYPVATIVLAYVVLKAPISRAQWVGAGVCLVAVALITR